MLCEEGNELPVPLPEVKKSPAALLASGRAHESPRTTKLYDRTSDEITLDEIERIGI
jgi:hypothetical protein